MKSIFIFCISLLSFSLQAQSSIQGIWNTGKDNSLVEIVQQTKGHWVGKLKSSDRAQAKVGRVILKDLKKKTNYWTGKIYVARKQKWYNVKLLRKSDLLEVQVSVGIFSKTLEWTKS
jgi:uncharacterized protein (DUF2147 family)